MESPDGCSFVSVFVSIDGEISSIFFSFEESAGGGIGGWALNDDDSSFCSSSSISGVADEKSIWKDDVEDS